jgi:hypothetical protein
LAALSGDLGPIHDHQCLGAVRLGLEGLFAQIADGALRRRCVERSQLRREAPRDHHFACDVQALEVVDAQLLVDDGVPDQHRGRADTAFAAVPERRELARGQRLAGDAQLGVRCALELGRDLKRKAIVACRSERRDAQLAQPAFDVRARVLQPTCADATPFACRIGEPRGVAADALRRRRLRLRRVRRRWLTGETCDEQVGVVCVLGSCAVGREDQPLPIRREHRKAIEARRVRDALQLRAVRVDRPQVELTTV